MRASSSTADSALSSSAANGIFDNAVGDSLSGGDALSGIQVTSFSMQDVSLDESNPFGSSCPQDKSLKVLTTTVVIPLSKACDIFQTLGQILKALAYIYATFILFKPKQ